MPIPREETARLRIAHLLRRQDYIRESDGLPFGILDSQSSPVSVDNTLVFGAEPDLRAEIVIWLLDVLSLVTYI